MWNFHASWFLVLEFPIGVTQFLRNFYEQSFFCLESPRLKWQTSKFQGSLFFLIFIIVQNKQKCLYTLNHFLFVCSFLLVLHLTITRLAISSSTVFHFTFMVLDGFQKNIFDQFQTKTPENVSKTQGNKSTRSKVPFWTYGSFIFNSFLFSFI